MLQSERAQYRELEETLEEQQSQSRRRERQLSNDLVLVTQVQRSGSYWSQSEHGQFTATFSIPGVVT